MPVLAKIALAGTSVVPWGVGGGSKARALARPRLLVVDDEGDMLDFLERSLRHEFEVMRFSDPVAALAEARATRFDVLICDQRMPKLSGLELLEEVARLWPGTVRVLISGFGDAPQLARALSTACVHNFLLKPIDADSLRDAIARATTRAGATA